MSNEKVARFNKQHHVIGLKQTLKALNRDQVTSLIMTRVLSQINHKHMPVSFFKSKKALGEYVGINVSATIVALVK